MRKTHLVNIILLQDLSNNISEKIYKFWQKKIEIELPIFHLRSLNAKDQGSYFPFPEYPKKAFNNKRSDSSQSPSQEF